MNNTSCDILVVGAGIAGISAAITAAEKGCHTILLEKHTHYGGIIRDAFLNEICGLFSSSDAKYPSLLNSGLCKNIYHLLADNDTGNIKRKGKVFVLRFSRKKLFPYIDNLLEKEHLLDLRYNHQMVSLNRNNTIIENILVTDNLNTGSYSIKPKIVIDCTGSGYVLDAAEQKGVESAYRQLAGVIMILNSTAPCDTLLAVKIPYILNTAVKEGIFLNYVKFTTVSAGENKNELNIKININSTVVSVTAIRDSLLKIHSYLKEKIKELENSTIQIISPNICYREENRLKGRYTITESDVLSGRKFHDGCVRGAWPIEYWHPNDGLSYQYLKSGDYYEIPIRSMQAADITNLYAAGRCISATPKALASTRVTGICMSLGEQAALSAVRQIKI